jgi:hypothetical protein
MEIKVGDKVRFLDAVGGGVVTSFKGKDTVLVLEEDGFETPVLKRKCVVVEETTSLNMPVRPKEVTPVAASVRAETAKPVLPKQPESREGAFLNLYLAFLPAEGHVFIDGCFECYLINDSNYQLMFNYASCSGKTWTSRAHGEIEPNSKLFLEEFGKDVISDLEKVYVQCLAYKPEGYYTFKNAVSVEIRIDTIKFYKVHCFRENDFFDEDALIVSVIKRDIPEKNLLVSPEEMKAAMFEKNAERPHLSQPLSKKPTLLEIDLHINELLDSTAGMDHTAMLQHQLDVFRKTMDENLARKGTKIVFIHGKGDGILRSALLNELRLKYKNCKSQDASFREYGYGATLVTIY